MLQLLGEGLFATWVAEDVGLGAGFVKKFRRRHFPEFRSDWLTIWPSIRPNPALRALHEEFAP